MNNNFSMQVIGEQNRTSRDYTHPHRHGEFEIIYFVCGAGRGWIDGNELAIPEKTIVCVPPNRMHQLRPGEGARGYILSFNSRFVHNSSEGGDLPICSTILDAFAVNPRLRQPGSVAAAELEDILSMLAREHENSLPSRTDMLCGLLKIFLICLGRLPGFADSERPRNRRALLTRSFFSVLEKEYMSRRMVADYANILSVTPNYLNEVVKSTSGFPASHHIQQRVILEAKRLVAGSGVPMKEIAWRLGFDDISHFSKFFKNFAGVNFRTFRRNGTILAPSNACSFESFS